MEERDMVNIPREKKEKRGGGKVTILFVGVVL